MAKAKKGEDKAKKYLVKVEDETYCGVGAGGVQFAYGQAVIHEGWVLNWYIDHGYDVTEIKENKDGNEVDPNATETEPEPEK